MDLQLQSETLRFALEKINLDWDKVVFSKIGVVRGERVWWAVEQYGPIKISVWDDTIHESNISQYVSILENFISPMANDIIYVQESNEITASNTVRGWFENHPEVQVITWPPNLVNVSPLAQAWSQMLRYVDRGLPVTLGEVKLIIYYFWDDIRDDPDQFIDPFSSMKEALRNIIQEGHEA